jgi:predicted metal-dependent phosphoesterase TrpH
MIVDLHCHSHYSDGSLSPLSLIKLAEENQVEVLSITDHDNVEAYKEIQKIKTDIKIIPGIEFSTSWNKVGVHIVGINIDTKSNFLVSAINKQKQTRLIRAEIIAKRLEKTGLVNALNKINKNGNIGQIGRPDFAKLLVNEGIAKDWNYAFKKFLGAGKIGDVKNSWLSLEEVLNSIIQSGGIPVLAHPLYYKMTNSKLKRLISDFKRMGGQGIEVLNGYQNPLKTNYLRQLCKDFGLKASIGSDFHNPSNWSKLGCPSSVIMDLEAVW